MKTKIKYEIFCIDKIIQVYTYTCYMYIVINDRSIIHIYLPSAGVKNNDSLKKIDG